MSRSPGAVDVLMATDLRFPGGTTASIVEEVTAQARAGYRTSLLHIPSPIQRPGVPFAPRIRSLLESGMADLVLDGPVHAKILVIRHPSVLTAMPPWLPQVTADHVLVVVNQVPVDPRAHAPYYDVLANHRAARRFSREEPVWAPIGPPVRAALTRFAPRIPILDYDWTNIVDTDAWYTPRDEAPGDHPVIGRHTRGHWSKWPADRQTLLAAYPADDRYTVQVLGGTEAPRDVLGYLPTNWVDLPFNSVAAAEFLGRTDFVVYYHHPALIEAFGRTVLEGAASGAVTIVDHRFKPTFGPACVYAAPQEVRRIIDRMSVDAEAYTAQSNRALAYVRDHFSYEAHAARLAALIGPAEPQADSSASDAAWQGASDSVDETHTLVVDLRPRGAIDATLIQQLDPDSGLNGPATALLLVPAARVTDEVREAADVETIPEVVDDVPARDRHRYVRARVEGILETFPQIRRVVVIGDPEVVAPAVPHEVVLQRAEQDGQQWSASEPVGRPNAVGARSGRSMAELAQRGVNLVRQRAPRPVIRLGLASKHAARALHTQTLGRLAPAGALLIAQSEIPRLPTPPSPISSRRPAALFVVTDPSIPVAETLRDIRRRAVISNAFRPVVLAPTTWIAESARHGIAVETFVLRRVATQAYTRQRSGYLRRRIAEVVQAFQPASAMTIRGGPGNSSSYLGEALDVAEELCTQRTASGDLD
ncbi:MAG TPA: hypothetical protein VK053_09010 [Jiangellaceae bacterium]|nr:hypothetical protein [Jiangellaceae bacterium]